MEPDFKAISNGLSTSAFLDIIYQYIQQCGNLVIENYDQLKLAYPGLSEVAITILGFNTAMDEVRKNKTNKPSDVIAFYVNDVNVEEFRLRTGNDNFKSGYVYIMNLKLNNYYNPDHKLSLESEMSVIKEIEVTKENMKSIICTYTDPSILRIISKDIGPSDDISINMLFIGKLVEYMNRVLVSFYMGTIYYSIHDNEPSISPQLSEVARISCGLQFAIRDIQGISIGLLYDKSRDSAYQIKVASNILGCYHKGSQLDGDDPCMAFCVQPALLYLEDALVSYGED